MLRPEVLATLSCPEERSRLTPASETLVAQMNALIRRGELRNRAGRIVQNQLDSGLTNASGELLYPILDGIPVLVREEAIPLNQLSDGSSHR
jgi:uncharacterized protein YbaR (Trm112 family)